MVNRPEIGYNIYDPFRRSDLSFLVLGNHKRISQISLIGLSFYQVFDKNFPLSSIFIW